MPPCKVKAWQCGFCGKNYSNINSFFRHINQKNDCWKHFQQTRSKNGYNISSMLLSNKLLMIFSFDDNEDEDINSSQSVESSGNEEVSLSCSLPILKKCP